MDTIFSTGHSMGRLAGDRSSRLLLDVAAGRPMKLNRDPSDDKLRLAVHHGLLGLMAMSSDRRLRQACLPPFIRLAARQEVMLRHLRRLLESLDKASVRAAVLKGPDLAHSVYENPAHRTFTDIDLLVPAADLSRALDVIAADYAVPAIPPKGPKADKRDIPVLDESGVQFSLDLHWDLFSYSQLRGCAAGASNSAWEGAWKSTASPFGPTWQVPVEAMLAFLCTHAVLDHRFRLILFRDLAEFARKGIDWERLVEFAGAWNLRSTTFVALLMASRFVDAAVPTAMLDALRPRSVPIWLAERMLVETDIVRFDGHQRHLLNLAMVLLHDQRRSRVALLTHAPVAFPAWQRRVEQWPAGGDRPRGDRKRLLLLVSSDRRRGAEVFGERLADGLPAHGWEVEFVSLASDSSGPWVAADAVSRRHSDQLGRFHLDVVRGLRRRIKQGQPDAVLANGASTLRYGVAAVLGIRRGPVLVYSSIGEPSYWLRSRWHVAAQRLLHNRTDLVLAVSEETGRQLADVLSLSEESLRVARTGVPSAFLDVVADPPTSDLRLLFLGNLSPEKNPVAAVRVLAALTADEKARLRFVGGGDLESQLRRTVRDLGLEDAVEFAGSVEDVLPHLAWADVLALTSKTEGFPGAVVEAAAARVPTVAYNVGGTGEAIIDGVTGLLVEPGDEDEFVRALGRLASDDALRSRLGRAARDLVKSKFLLEDSVANHDRLLREALSGGEVEALSGS